VVLVACSAVLSASFLAQRSDFNDPQVRIEEYAMILAAAGNFGGIH
jgi:hypothetical protein